MNNENTHAFFFFLETRCMRIFQISKEIFYSKHFKSSNAVKNVKFI